MIVAGIRIDSRIIGLPGEEEGAADTDGEIAITTSQPCQLQGMAEP